MVGVTTLKVQVDRVSNASEKSVISFDFSWMHVKMQMHALFVDLRERPHQSFDRLRSLILMKRP